MPGAPSVPGLPIVRVVMTDRDVMQRVSALLQRALIPLRPRRDGYKTPYAVTLKGAPAVDLMRVAAPFVGDTRRHQIARAIASWSGRHRGEVHHVAPDTHLSTDERDAAWLAGLLEGEGCFTVTRAGGLAYPVVSIHMTERSVIERVARLFDAPGKVWVEQPRRVDWRTTYATALTGKAAAGLMTRLGPLMGQRRRAAIDAALAAYAPIRLVDPPSTCVVPGCDAPHRSRGLCHRHYMSWLRDVAKGRAPRVTPLR